MDGDDFNNDYLKVLSHNLNKENDKRVYLAGDFNFDLLKDTHREIMVHFKI